MTRLPIPTRSALLALALLAAATGSAGAGAACPEGSASLGGYGTGYTVAAAWDTSSSTYGSYHVASDLTTGTLQMQQCCNLAATFVDAADLYDVQGVAPGTPVALTVQLVVDDAVISMGCGGTGCSGTVGATIQHGADIQRVEHTPLLFTGRDDYHDVLLLPVTIVAGTPERIDFTAYGHRNPGGNHASEAYGTFTFLGLPAGASVTSCQGYAPLATPARPSTWGRLKAIYR